MDAKNPLVDDIMRKLDEARNTLPVPMHTLTTPFEPPVWPREEMETMYRFLARETGLPARCRDRRCRRKGHCHGGIMEDSACMGLWDEAAVEKLLAAGTALVLAWMNEVRRLYDRAEMLDDVPMDDEPREEAAVQ